MYEYYFQRVVLDFSIVKSNSISEILFNISQPCRCRIVHLVVIEKAA